MKQSHSPARLLPHALLALSLASCATQSGAERSTPSSTPLSTPGETMDRAPRASPAVKGTPGAAGIGDELFPTAGNGGYDVQTVELSIAMDKVGGPIEATAKLRAKATQDLSSFDLDLHGLDVRSVEVDGAAATFTRVEDELVITPANALANGSEFTTLVRYGGTPEGVDEPALFGIKVGWMTKDEEVYVFSQPTGAKSFMPCNDHPRDKALYTLSITAPKPAKAVCNGTLAETIDVGDKRTFVYRPRDPMASYLVTIAIAEFVESERAGPGGLEIRNYFSPKSRQADRDGFDRTDEIVKFLGEKFGPYPFETCGNILACINVPGALETQTIPIYGAGISGASIICHEQAHQWFGDAVSVENWRDIWLNEGFAEYASWMYLEASEGRPAFDTKVKRQYGAQRTQSDRRAAASRELADGSTKPKPPLEPPARPSSKSMFGSVVYIRGALALDALRTEVGDDAFLGLLRTWVTQNANGNATVEEFLAHVENSTTKTARTMLEHWILDEEMPHIAALDEQLAKDKAERDAKRKARDAQKKKDAEEPEPEKKDG
ncbi:MAG TPA: M1 family aminopeptidase [Planctomycetota bacterium]|nr:M1 family aminopeptidase [Planctomycetota bacterium]